MLEALFSRCYQSYLFRKKQAVGPATPKSDTLIVSAVAVYPIDEGYEEDR